MRYFKRLRQFKNSKGTFKFDLDRLEARSYGWYLMCMPYKGKMIINTATYSHATGGHEREMNHILYRLGVSNRWNGNYLAIDAPRGLDNLQDAVDSHLYSINKLKEEIAKPGTWKNKNRYRKQRIAYHVEQIKLIKLIKRSPNKIKPFVKIEEIHVNKQGQFHNDSGPAIVTSAGYKNYFLNGKEVPKEQIKTIEFNKELKEVLK